MVRAVEHHLNTAATGFNARRMQPFLAFTVMPFAVQIADEFLPFQDHDSLEEALLRYQAVLAGKGVSALQPHVRALELPRQGRFRLWVEMVFLRGAEPLPQTSAAILYARDTGRGPMLEMVQFLRCAHPGLKRLIAPRVTRH